MKDADLRKKEDK